MKISKYIQIDEKVKCNKWQLTRLKLFNTCKIKGYVVCTGSRGHWLFEILEVHHIKKQHTNCYAVGIAASKDVAMEQVRELIDKIYNQKIQTYEALKTN